MFIRKISKLFLAGILGISLVACSSSNEPSEPIKVLSPTGAPALSLLSLFGDDKVEVETVEGTDVLIAELSKKDSEYDMIVAPTNLGTKIYEKTENYQLESVLTWGNLYLVGVEGSTLENDVEIAAFGEKAVPQLVFSHIFDIEALSNVTYYGSVQEAQQAILTGKAEVALLAQPVAQATIAKAKEQEINLSIFADLQELWQHETKSEEKGYPQASLFVKKDVDVSYALELLENQKEMSEEGLKEKIESIGIDVFGVPSAELAIQTWKAQNIRYTKASEVVEQIEEFLDLFGLGLPKGIIR